MRKTGWMAVALATTMSLAACTTNDGYYSQNDRQLRGAGTGAAVGAAGGAAVGAIVDGISTVEGAVAGAAVGAVVGAVTADKDRRWYRDNYGRCYYVNSRGDRIYDDRVRC